VPRLDLDTSIFDACATAARAAADVVSDISTPALASGATGDPAVEAALGDLGHAWAADIALLATQMAAVAAALTSAGRVFATAEGDVVGTLTALLGQPRGAR